MPYDFHVRQYCYLPVNEVLKLSKTNILLKVYDQLYVEIRFALEDIVIYEEFKYPETRKLDPTFNRPYKITNKL